MRRRENPHAYTWVALAAAVLLATLCSSSLLQTATGLDRAMEGEEHGAVKSRVDGEKEACSDCHLSRVPTAKDPALRLDLCTRRDRINELSAVPDKEFIELNALENLYNGVHFNHRRHASMSEMSGGCENCHHYAPPTKDFPACADCHLREALMGKIEPSLKAAYHEQCMGCHREWDTDTHCEFCHRKKEGGLSEEVLSQLPFVAHAGPLESPGMVTFETEYKVGDKVPFHHNYHVDAYCRNCSCCHKDESCSSCHVHGEGTVALGLQTMDKMHDVCAKCHSMECDSEDEKDCGHCHGRSPDDRFDHASTGWPIKGFHSHLQCYDCHRNPGRYEGIDPRCVTCHFDGFPSEFDHSITGVVFDENHLDIDCIDCHEAGFGSVANCEVCHDEGEVVWDPEKGFTAK